MAQADRKTPKKRLKAAGSSTPEERPTIPSAERKSFPIVGVGASAGGLEAFTKLLEHLPSTTGMAFVLIQHFDPHHASQFPDLLSRKSSMPVQEAQGDTQVEADHVYVIPSNANLTIKDGVLHSVPRATDSRVQHISIDDFLKSLAEDRGNLAFGVILSGTASDGTPGLKAIKSAGGITFAQELTSAKFGRMPSI